MTRYFRLLLGANLLAAICWAPACEAEHTRYWRQSSYEEFLKGTAHGVAVRSDGRLELSPKFTQLGDADASYLWSVRVGPKGAVYAAGGSPARVFRFDGGGGGKPVTVFESPDMSAQAIAFDSKGTLYVATSPDGKVYRVSPSGEKSVFFDTKTKYVWDLAFGPDGKLYVATGDKGQVFWVTPDGKGEALYNSDEAHIRVLAFDAQGNLLAGTEPNGRVLRITPVAKRNGAAAKNEGSAEAFVLYETAKREITSLAVGSDGSIYASAIGEKQRAVITPAPTTVITSPQGTTTIGGGTIIAGPQNPSPFVAFPPLLSSSIYKIAKDGAPEELWSSRDDVVYGLALNNDGRLLAGTGNSGALLAIDGRGVFAQLAKAGSAQITGIARGSDGRIFLCTANPGKVFSLGPEYEVEGVYESRAFDAQLFSQWGAIDWFTPAVKGGKEGGTGAPRAEFFVRTGNTEDPGKEWSRWSGPYEKAGSRSGAPSARFVQWKAVIHDGRPGDGIDWVSIAYLPRNVAPVIEGIAVQDLGVRAQGQTSLQIGQQPSANLRLPQSANPGGLMITQIGQQQRFEQPPQGFLQKGFATVLWSAHDDNEDELRFAVYYRGENETGWKLLKDKIEQKFYSWDATGMPDGAYYLKITASDSASNPPAEALSTERESERFVIDNTPPLIEGLGAKPTGKSSAFEVQFTAKDSASCIERAQYSVDGSDWILVAPTGNLSDSTAESYVFSTEELSGGEHSIAVRAFDRFENSGSAKITITAPNKKQ